MEGHAGGGPRDLGLSRAWVSLAGVILGSSPPGMGVKQSLQSGGTMLGFLANSFIVLSTASNYWIRYSGGHSGLWQECNEGICSNIPCDSEALRPSFQIPAPRPPPPSPHLPVNRQPPALTTAAPSPDTTSCSAPTPLLFPLRPLRDRGHHEPPLWDLLPSCNINLPS